MPNLFGSQNGRITYLDSQDGSLPLGLVVGTLKSELGIKGLLTSMSISGQSGFQVMHTLRDYIYIYTFGERIGEIIVNGLAFVADCDDYGSISEPGDPSGTGQPVLNSPTGLNRLIDWYELNRISTTGAGINITLTTDYVIRGFLTGFRFQIEDPSMSLGQFSLQFFYPPRLRSATDSPIFPLTGVWQPNPNAIELTSNLVPPSDDIPAPATDYSVIVTT